METRGLLCPEHGMIELPAGTDRCPDCGMTALDPLDPANADAITEAKALHATRGFPMWVLGPLILAGMVAPFVAMKFSKGAMVGYVQPLVIYGGSALIALYMWLRESPAWKHVPSADQRTPARKRRALTSAPLVAAAVCLAMVAVTQAVGIPALDYRHGDELRAPWRLLTSSFVHAGAIHFLGNVIVLLAVGLPVDLRVGRARTWLVLLVAAVGGALVQGRFVDEPMVGLSGGIYGLIGAMLALMPRRPRLLAFGGVPVPMPTWAWCLIVIPLFTFMAWVDQGAHIGWVAHVAGFGMGFLLGLPMRRVEVPAEFLEAEERNRRAVERAAT